MLIVVVKTRDVLLLSLLLSAWSAAAQGSRLNVSTFLANFSPNIGLLDDSVEYHVVVFSEPQTITDFVQNLNYDEVGEWSMSTCQEWATTLRGRSEAHSDRDNDLRQLV